MVIIELVRWSQVIALSIAAAASLFFLIMYRTRWDLSNIYTRFLILLNAFFIFTVASVAIGRLLPFNIVIEVIKTLVFVALAGIMAFQIYLFRYTNRK